MYMYTCVFSYVLTKYSTTDNASAPQNLSARVSESHVCDDNGCVVTVEWSEPFISCAGSVSQYVLSVTPPTCDCPSSPNCVVMDGRAVYTLSGSERQHNITVNRTTSPEYGVTVRADTCDNTLTGEPSSEYNIDLTGIIILCTCIILSCEAHNTKLHNFTARRRVSQASTYYYIYDLASTSQAIESIVVSWSRFDVSCNSYYMNCSEWSSTHCGYQPFTDTVYTSVKIIQLNEYGCRDAPCKKSWKQGNPLSKDTSTIMRNPLSELCREGYV